MGMSGVYGPADRAESINTIHAALDQGVSLIDTADFYGMGHNEMLIGEALRGGRREQAVISVKQGALRDPSGGWHGNDSHPRAIRNFLAYTLQRLGVDYIDIYRPSRLDAAVPIEDTVGAIADMVKAGYVRHVGLSEVGPAIIRRAAAVHPISDLQIEYSLLTRDIETVILPTCRELRIGITAYGILSRGLLGGQVKADSVLGKGDLRNASPRFQGANRTANLQLVSKLADVAKGLGRSVAQTAIAWVAAQGADIVPLIGTRRRDKLDEALAAVKSPLTPQEIAMIEAAVPKGAAVGDRYPTSKMVEVANNA